MNRLKTLLLLAALTGLLLFAGQAVGGRAGLTIALGIAFVMNSTSYWFADRIVLRMYGAKEVSEAEAPRFHALVRRLAERAGIPMPKVYIIPEDAPNAFATGRNPEHAAVAATEGLLRLLNEDEIAGVMAHELGHVKNRDTLIMTVAATLAGALGFIAQMGMLFGGSRDDDEAPSPIGAIGAMLLAMFAAPLIQMAISRSREFLADEAGAAVSGNPLALASALRKLDVWKREVPMHHGSPATAHLFIVNPFSGGGLASLFSTHPSTAARIDRLEAMASSSGAASRLPSSPFSSRRIQTI